MCSLALHRQELRCRRIGNTKHFQGIVHHPALDIFVIDIPDLDTPFNALPLRGRVVISKTRDRHFERDQLGLLIAIIIQPRIQFPIGPGHEGRDQQPVTEEAEQQDEKQQYGGNLFQTPENTKKWAIGPL